MNGNSTPLKVDWVKFDHESDMMKAAMAYAEVEFEGVNKQGQPRYSAVSPYLLEMREHRMCAFLAGWEAHYQSTLQPEPDDGESEGP